MQDAKRENTGVLIPMAMTAMTAGRASGVMIRFSQGEFGIGIKYTPKIHGNAAAREQQRGYPHVSP